MMNEERRALNGKINLYSQILDSGLECLQAFFVNRRMHADDSIARSQNHKGAEAPV